MIYNIIKTNFLNIIYRQRDFNFERQMICRHHTFN